VRVRQREAIALPTLESAPEPDLAWVVQRDYGAQRPTAAEVQLVIEVAGSSLVFDTGEKADLYAAAGIREYWVVDVAARSVEVRRVPLADGYGSLASHRGGEAIHPLAMPDAVLRPGALWEFG